MAWNDLLMEEDLTEQKRDANVRPAQSHTEMALPSQTRGYLQRTNKRFSRRVAICIALFVSGDIAIGISVHARPVMPAPVWLGVVLIVLSVLLPLSWVFKFKAAAKKEHALREVGTVELLRVSSAYVHGGEQIDTWDLTCELQIRLDSGNTFRGSYRTSVEDWRLRKDFGPLDTWFCVGRSMRCLYNPTNPDKVIAFRHAVRGDKVSYNELTNTGLDHLSFYSAT